jgi:uncharacterized protein (DUF58 family)
VIPLLPTARLLALLLLPAVILLASTWAPPLGWLALLVALLALVAAGLDLRLSIRPRQVTLSRSHDALLSIGAANTITVRVGNSSSQPLTFRLRDEAPDEFETTPRVLEGAAPPRQDVSLPYTVKPFRRGEYRFGNINLRYRSALGLLERQMKVATEDRAIVYPDILELRKHTLTARGGDQEVARRTRLRGGTEFERLREYTPDDEFRYIDWNATARLRRPIARQFQTERNQNIILAYDLGRQMTSPYGDLLKVDYAINSGVVLGYVGAQRGENIGLLTFNDSVRTYLPPRSGMGQYKRILDALYRAQPELVEPDYAEAMGYVGIRNPRRSLVVVFTDVASKTSGEVLLRSVVSLQPRHLPVLVLLMDPELKRYAEEEPADEDGLYRAAVAQRLLEERSALLKTLESRGVITIDVPAEQLTVSLLDRYLQVKGRGAL